MRVDAVRHQHILESLYADKRVSVAEMAGRLSVSMETIRRDLKLLEERGRLRRIHGGAMPVLPQRDRPLPEREHIGADEKAVVAQLTLAMLERNSTVFLDTGTTTLALARALGGLAALTVVTNSLDIASTMSRFGQHGVQVAGGTLRANDNALVGYDTLEFVRKYSFDVAVMGIAAIDAERGFMDFEDDEAELRRVLARQARLRLVVAHHGKFGVQARIRTLGFRDVDRLVTDRAPDRAFADAFTQAGLEVVHG
jgi:DeoR family glycerol-3-phosphate regulon repressor